MHKPARLHRHRCRRHCWIVVLCSHSVPAARIQWGKSFSQSFSRAPLHSQVLKCLKVVVKIEFVSFSSWVLRGSRVVLLYYMITSRMVLVPPFRLINGGERIGATVGIDWKWCINNACNDNDDNSDHRNHVHCSYCCCCHRRARLEYDRDHLTLRLKLTIQFRVAASLFAASSRLCNRMHTKQLNRYFCRSAAGSDCAVVNKKGTHEKKGKKATSIKPYIFHWRNDFQWNESRNGLFFLRFSFDTFRMWHAKTLTLQWL